MKIVFLLFIFLSCLSCFGDITNAVLSFTPKDGIVSYSVWRAIPPDTIPRYVSTITAPPYSLGTIPEETKIWVKSSFLMANGLCCVESDFGYAVVQPQNTNGTNFLDIKQAGTNAINILVSDKPQGPFTNIATFVDNPVLLQKQRIQFIKTQKTFIPPNLP